MKVKYYQETDSLYIDLADAPSKDSREVTDGIVLDYNAAGNLVGIDIDKASLKVALDQLVVSSLPGMVVTVTA